MTARQQAAAAAATLWLLLSALVGCAPAEACEGAACACAVERQLPSGVCCTGFTGPDGARCGVRDWQLPGLGEAFGPTGADALTVAIDANGSGVAAWVTVPPEQLQSEVTVAQERDGWATTFPGLALDGFGNRPSLAAGPRGEVLVAWQQELVEDSRVHLSARDGDGQWSTTSEQRPVSAPPLANQPFAHISPRGEAFVVFNQFHGTQYGVAIARRPETASGAAFELPSDAADVISPAVNFSNAPRIATATNGDALISWYQNPEPAGDLVVYASRRQGRGGVFARPDLGTFVSPSGGTIDGLVHRNPVPFMGSHGFGGVTWTQRTADGALAVYLATMDGRGVWTTPSSIEETFSPPGGDVQGATAELTSRNELFVLWTQARAGRNVAFAAHRNAGGEFDVPGRDPVALSDPLADALEPDIASGPNGGVVAAWSERTAGRWQVRSRIRNAGATRWSVPTTLSTDDSVDALSPVVAVGPDGRALVAWLVGDPGQARVQFATL